MDYHVKYGGKLLKFADKLIKMAKEFVLEGLYYIRVIDGGGTVANRGLVEDLYKLWEQQGRLDNIKVAILPQAGSVQRTSGIYRFFSKLFTLRTDANDITQTTANSQPYFVNGAMVNPNGASRFMTHPTVSFGAGDAWSVSWVINWSGSNLTNCHLQELNVDPFTTISLKKTHNRIIIFSKTGSDINFLLSNTPILINKISQITITKNGTLYSLYINGLLIQSVTSTERPYTFSRFSSAGGSYFGSIHSYTVESGALTPTQILEEYNLLRSYIPEIATTLIGTKNIATENCQMVATPMGRVINLNNTAGNVELITNAADREFSSDTGWWTKSTGVTIADGVAKFVNVGTSSGLSRNGLLVAGSGKTIKVTFTISNYSSGGIRAAWSTAVESPIYNANGTYTIYLRGVSATTGTFYLYGSSFPTNLHIDNVSVEEFNWAGASDLYTAIYNQTSGTVSQKTSAALLAAAMWRSPDADLDKQAVFGKIFNDYAAALMRFDIAAYNTANPSTPWGYHVMTRAEEQALAALDADTLKSNALWTSTNGTNETGLSLLGSGVINADGTYSNFGTKTRLMTGEGYALDVNDDGTSAEIAVTTEGGILRLVKD